MYAARDMELSIDPGPALSVPEEDEEEENEGSLGTDEPGARRNARRILTMQSQSVVPDDSMWRSLAN